MEISGVRLGDVLTSKIVFLGFQEGIQDKTDVGTWKRFGIDFETIFEGLGTSKILVSYRRVAFFRISGIVR